jgi:hypothetical protein
MGMSSQSQSMTTLSPGKCSQGTNCTGYLTDAMKYREPLPGIEPLRVISESAAIPNKPLRAGGNGGGLEYLHRNPESRKRRRKRKNQSQMLP